MVHKVDCKVELYLFPVAVIIRILLKLASPNINTYYRNQPQRQSPLIYS